MLNIEYIQCFIENVSSSSVTIFVLSYLSHTQYTEMCNDKFDDKNMTLQSRILFKNHAEKKLHYILMLSQDRKSCVVSKLIYLCY